MQTVEGNAMRLDDLINLVLTLAALLTALIMLLRGATEPYWWL